MHYQEQHFTRFLNQDFRTYNVDGRFPIEVLYKNVDILASKYGWEKTLVYTQKIPGLKHGEKIELPIFSYHTPKQGPALWVVTMVHGEEPAGPNALAQNIDVLVTLAQAGVPIVLLPFCNPKGYYLDWRYPGERRPTVGSIGFSATGATHALPHEDNPARTQMEEPETEESAAMITHVWQLFQTHPCWIALDFHEDEASMNPEMNLRERVLSYIYNQGFVEHDPIAAQVNATLRHYEFPMHTNGITRFGEEIHNGVVVMDESGDGSLDDFIAADMVYINGVWQPKFLAASVTVVETPTMRLGESHEDSMVPIPLEKRVAAHSAILQSLPLYWKMLPPPTAYRT